MTTRKMNITLLGFRGISVIAAWLLVSITQAGAETLKFKINEHIVQSEGFRVADVEGHVMGLYSKAGVAFFENGEIAMYRSWSSSDTTKGKGQAQGYMIFTFEDGSAFVQKWQGTFVDRDPFGLEMFQGTGEFIKGTRRFEGIKGNLSFTAKDLTPLSREMKTMGDVAIDATATYTLPSK